MKIIYRQLGGSGLRVSVYALGTNAFGGRADAEVSQAMIHHALDHGVNLFDTANVYAGGNSERIIGKALRGRRTQVILATKCGKRTGDGPNDEGTSRSHIMCEIERSLRRLETDYVDLYQVHQFDAQIPIEETLRALDDLVRQGKVRYIGCSKYAAWQLGKALWTSDRSGFVRFTAALREYSPADRRIEAEFIPLCLDQGIALLAYYPLAGGILTGKYRAGAPPPAGSRALTQPDFAGQPDFAAYITDQRLRLVETMGRIAADAGLAVSQLALAWVMDRPGVTSVLVGATRVSQQDENLRAIDIALDAEVAGRVTEVSGEFVAF